MSKRIEPSKFRRPCKSCGELFYPKGKFSRLCDKCYYEIKVLSRKVTSNMEQEKTERRTDLQEYYKEVRVCKTCGKEYGYDKQYRNPYPALRSTHTITESRNCPTCTVGSGLKRWK